MATTSEFGRAMRGKGPRAIPAASDSSEYAQRYRSLQNDIGLSKSGKGVVRVQRMLGEGGDYPSAEEYPDGATQDTVKVTASRKRRRKIAAIQANAQ